MITRLIKNVTSKQFAMFVKVANKYKFQHRFYYSDKDNTLNIEIPEQGFKKVNLKVEYLLKKSEIINNNE